MPTKRLGDASLLKDLVPTQISTVDAAVGMHPFIGGEFMAHKQTIFGDPFGILVRPDGQIAIIARCDLAFVLAHACTE